MVEVAVGLRAALDEPYACVRCALVQALVKYILFVRKQMPRPVDELLASRAADEGAARSLAAQRLGRSVDSARMALQALDWFGARFAPDLAVVILGHSPTLPKEVYVVHFGPAGPHLPCEEGLTVEKMAHDCSRRMLRRLVAQVEADSAGHWRPMKVWVLLHVDPQRLAAEAPIALAKAGFQRRPAFRLRLAKSGRLVLVKLEGPVANDVARPAGQAAASMEHAPNSASASAPTAPRTAAAQGFGSQPLPGPRSSTRPATAMARTRKPAHVPARAPEPALPSDDGWVALHAVLKGSRGPTEG